MRGANADGGGSCELQENHAITFACTDHLETLVDRVPGLVPPFERALRDPDPTQYALPAAALHVLDLLKDIVRVLVLLGRAGREVGARDEELREERVGGDGGRREGGEERGRERGEV